MVRPMLSDCCLFVLSVCICHNTFMYCGQMVGWIIMLLGTVVCLGSDHTVLDGDSAHPQRSTAPAPSFWPMSVVAKWLDDQDATWYGDRPQPMQLCVRWEPSSP